MSDFDRTRLADGGEERLPWLEAVEEERPPQGPRAATLVAAVVVALIAIGLVVGGVFLLRDRRTAPGSGDLIAAPEGNYKVKPDHPGGMNVQSENDTSFASVAGSDTNAAIDLSAIPETPVAGAGSVTNADAAANAPPPKPLVPAKPLVPVQTAKAETKPAEKAETKPAEKPAAKPVQTAAARPAPAPAKPAPSKPVQAGTATVALDKPAPEHVAAAAPKPAPAAAPVAPAGPAAPGTIQLGAFSSQAKADAAWKSLSGRFGSLAALPKMVVPVSLKGTTLYRLRAAAGSQASTVCAKLKVAGESCAVVG